MPVVCHSRKPALRIGRRVRLFFPLGLASMLGGCSTAPAQNLFGSFIPAWLICVGLGLLAAVCARQLLLLAGLDGNIVAPPLTYLGVAVAATLLIWLIWFGH